MLIVIIITVTGISALFHQCLTGLDLFIICSLSGKQHTVFTGVVIKTPNILKKFYDQTNVYVAKMDEKTIKAYIATNEPM